MLNLLNSKTYRLSLRVIAIIMLSYSLFLLLSPYFSDVPKNDNVPVLKDDLANFGGQVKLKEKIPLPFTGTTESEQKTKTHQRTAADVAVVEDWFRHVGYSTKDYELYRSYSDAVLEGLSNNGDIIALHIMEERKIAHGDVNGAKAYAEKGIAYGSLLSIKSMANYNDPSFRMDRFSAEETKPALLQTLAYYELLSMRGNTRDASLFRRTLLDQYKNAYQLTNVLTTDDEKAIQEQATQLYQKYQTERVKLGLGNFDSNLPKAVKDFFDM